MLKNLINGIIQAIPQLVAALPQVITAFVNYFTSNAATIVTSGVDILMALIQGIIESIPVLIENIPKIMEAIVNGLSNLIPNIVTVGGNIVKGIWQGIQNMGSWLWNKLTGWVNDVFGWIKGLLGIHSPSTLMRDKIGKMMGLGVAEGILDSEKAVERAFASIMPDANTLAGAIDGYSVASSIAGSGRGSSRNPFIDNRPIVIKLNDRELGRAVRGYA